MSLSVSMSGLWGGGGIGGSYQPGVYVPLKALFLVFFFFFFFFFFLNSVLRPFQDYFSSYETGQSVGGRKRENPEKNHLAHLQAELGLSHMWPERGSNPHQTQR